MDICTILQMYPNYEALFRNLTWWKCQDKYVQKLSLYQKDKQAVPFESGTDKEHTSWEDVMEEISQHIGDGDAVKEVSVDYPAAQDPKQMEKDMKIVGELLRDD